MTQIVAKPMHSSCFQYFKKTLYYLNQKLSKALKKKRSKNYEHPNLKTMYIQNCKNNRFKVTIKNDL
jgi:hypothetical protein